MIMIHIAKYVKYNQLYCDNGMGDVAMLPCKFSDFNLRQNVGIAGDAIKYLTLAVYEI